MDALTFRQIFPEFITTPDPAIDFWLNLGKKQLNADRWDDLLNEGLALFTAHHLAIAERDRRTADAGGVPGALQGNVTAKSVDKVSVSYDTSSGTYADAGFWNLTNYGVRYWNLMQMVGAGGIQM